MVEYHGWITIRLNFKDVEDLNDENIGKLVNLVHKKITGYNLEKSISLRFVNGTAMLSCNGLTNHWGGDIEDVLALYNYLAKEAVGSYGLLYFRNDEANDEESNNFTVYYLAKGELKKTKDNLLSPCIPVIEDEIS